MFGPEPTGLDAATLADPHITAQVRIPMLAGRRSLNLSNAAAVAVYEAWRQQGFCRRASLGLLASERRDGGLRGDVTRCSSG